MLRDSDSSALSSPHQPCRRPLVCAGDSGCYNYCTLLQNRAATYYVLYYVIHGIFGESAYQHCHFVMRGLCANLM